MGFKALFQLVNFTLGPDATLQIRIAGIFCMKVQTELKVQDIIIVGDLNNDLLVSNRNNKKNNKKKKKN